MQYHPPERTGMRGRKSKQTQQARLQQEGSRKRKQRRATEQAPKVQQQAANSKRGQMRATELAPAGSSRQPRFCKALGPPRIAPTACLSVEAVKLKVQCLSTRPQASTQTQTAHALNGRPRAPTQPLALDAVALLAQPRWGPAQLQQAGRPHFSSPKCFEISCPPCL